jgi:MFS family permease
VGRFFFGVAAGSITVYVPKYVEEVSPIEVKGQMGTMFQLFLTFGIFVGPLVALPIPARPETNCGIDAKCIETLNTWKDSFYVNQYWHIMFGLPILTAFLQLALFGTCFRYETPTFLKRNGKTEELEILMNKIYSADQVQKRIDDIPVQGNTKTMGYKESLLGPQYRKAVMVGFVLSMTQ